MTDQQPSIVGGAFLGDVLHTLHGRLGIQFAEQDLTFVDVLRELYERTGIELAEEDLALVASRLDQHREAVDVFVAGLVAAVTGAPLPEHDDLLSLPVLDLIGTDDEVTAAALALTGTDSRKALVEALRYGAALLRQFPDNGRNLPGYTTIPFHTSGGLFELTIRLFGTELPAPGADSGQGMAGVGLRRFGADTGVLLTYLEPPADSTEWAAEALQPGPWSAITTGTSDSTTWEA
jgi:hypothetical protein